jgi:hypothetical protein
MQRFSLRELGRSVVIALSAISFFVPSLVLAAGSFTVTPAVIDGKGKVREILHYNMTVVNTTGHLVSVYPWVTDIDPTEGNSGTSDLAGTREKELSESLARWIEVTRGSVDLLPGQQKEVPITIQINLGAKPGLYHSAIHLSAGGTRPDAEANRTDTMDIMVNIEVLDDINERLQLNTFIPTKGVFGGDSASFNYNIENIGNRGEVPHGKIRIYDKGGREVAAIDANEDGKRLEPSSKQMLSSVWASGGSFGRYKAMLDLEYGSRGTLQDTVFFWVIPWKKLASMFLSLIVLCVAAAIVMHSYAASRRRAFAAEKAQWGRGEETDEEWEEPGYDARVNELRRVEPPPPVHTKPHSPWSSPGEATHLSDMPKADLSSHKVILGKREPPAPPKEHIVNLKR